MVRAVHLPAGQAFQGGLHAVDPYAQHQEDDDYPQGLPLAASQHLLQQQQVETSQATQEATLYPASGLPGIGSNAARESTAAGAAGIGSHHARHSGSTAQYSSTGSATLQLAAQQQRDMAVAQAQAAAQQRESQRERQMAALARAGLAQPEPLVGQEALLLRPRVGTAPTAALAAGAQLSAVRIVTAPPRYVRRSAATTANGDYEDGDDHCSIYSIDDGSDQAMHSASTEGAEFVRKRRKRGFWGHLLRVTGIVTTVASVALGTGAAIFAAAALNTGFDELDHMQPGVGARGSGNKAGQRGGRARGELPPPPFFPRAPHPDALAAGRG